MRQPVGQPVAIATEINLSVGGVLTTSRFFVFLAEKQLSTGKDGIVISANGARDTNCVVQAIFALRYL